MNNYLYSFIITTIAGLSTLLGSIVILFKIKSKNIEKFIVLCLSFAIAIMIGISITDLIPNSFKTLIKVYSLSKIISILILSFIIAYFIITKIEKIINHKTNNNELYKLGLLNMLVLILHNLPEGIATFLSSYHDIEFGIKLSIVIMFHNIPEGISIAVPIYYATKDKKKAFKASLISGISEPAGALLAYIVFKNIITDILISIVLIIVGCIMITLSIEQILPKVKSYEKNKYIIYGMIIGLIFIIINICFH